MVVSDNSLTFEHDQKPLQLCQETYTELCTMANKVSSSHLLNLWNRVIESEQLAKKQLKSLPGHKALDKQIENGRKRLREAEAEYRSVKEEYCSVAFDYNKSMESLKKCFEKEMTEDMINTFTNCLKKDYTQYLEDKRSRLIEKKQKLFSLMA